MEKMREKVNKACLEELGNPDIRFSAGITKCKNGKQISDMIKEVDSALYLAKARGKDQVVKFKKES